jgi:hypothetical protein
MHCITQTVKSSKTAPVPATVGWSQYRLEKGVRHQGRAGYWP